MLLRIESISCLNSSNVLALQFLSFPSAFQKDKSRMMLYPANMAGCLIGWIFPSINQAALQNCESEQYTNARPFSSPRIDRSRIQHSNEFGNSNIAEVGYVKFITRPQPFNNERPFMDQRTVSICFWLAIVWSTWTGRSASDTAHR
jgi:hypothetical protein